MSNDECLRELLEYHADTGFLVWRKGNNRRVHSGDRAGCVTAAGYRQIRVNGVLFLAHRIAWFLSYGYWPTMIDHLNGQRDDNRIENLREVTARENMCNMARHRAGRLVGAHHAGPRYKSKPWRALVVEMGKLLSLGYYATEQEAHGAYESFIGGK